MRKHAVEHIACITDLTAQTLPAFHHALALALATRAKLTLLYIGPEHREDIDWKQFPQVRDTLERWGKLPAGSQHTSVAEQLGVDVRKQVFRDQSPLQGLRAFVHQHHTDLVVTCLPRRGRLQRWFREAGLEGLVGLNLTHMLILPSDTDGFIGGANGISRLSRVLFPLAAKPDPATALRLCEQLLPSVAAGGLQVTLLHIGDRGTAPELIPLQGKAHWQWQFGKGSVVEQILTEAERAASDLLVMPSAGRPGLWQALRRSNTEQVLQRSRRPVLVVASN